MKNLSAQEKDDLRLKVFGELGKAQDKKNFFFELLKSFVNFKTYLKQRLGK